MPRFVANPAGSTCWWSTGRFERPGCAGEAEGGSAMQDRAEIVPQAMNGHVAGRVRLQGGTASNGVGGSRREGRSWSKWRQRSGAKANGDGRHGRRRGSALSNAHDMARQMVMVGAPEMACSDTGGEWMWGTLRELGGGDIRGHGEVSWVACRLPGFPRARCTTRARGMRAMVVA